jgi:hypothetical protein
MTYKMQPAYLYNEVDVAASANHKLFLGAYTRVAIWVHAEDAPTGTSPTLDIKLQYKIPREDADWVDIASASITQLTGGSSYPATDVINVSGDDLMADEYRLVLTIGGTDTPTFTDVTIVIVGEV